MRLYHRGSPTCQALQRQIDGLRLAHLVELCDVRAPWHRETLRALTGTAERPTLVIGAQVFRGAEAIPEELSGWAMR